MTYTQNVEFRRTFNLGDYETVNLSTILCTSRVGSHEFYCSQIELIVHALELFKCRKIAAKQVFNNKLVDFCEKQENQLSKEKELLEDALSKAPPSLPPILQVNNTNQYAAPYDPNQVINYLSTTNVLDFTNPTTTNQVATTID